MKPEEFTSLNKANGAEVLETSSLFRLHRLKIAEPVEKALLYQAHPAVEYAKPNYIFAEVGEDHITLFDVELTIYKFIPLLRQRYAKPEAKEKLLRSLLKDKLYSNAARDEDLLSIPEVRREVNEAVEKTLARIYMKNIQADAISGKEMQTFYKKNIKKFQAPEQIRGRRILTKSRQDAEDILDKLKSGAAFGRLAMERSLDPTGQKGGGFGWAGRGSMPPAVSKAAFALEKGEISDIIDTRAGFFIIKVEDKRAARNVPFSKVRDKVQKRLKEEKRKEAVDKKTKELEEKYHVRMYTEFLSEVKVPVDQKIGLQDIDSIKMLREVINKALERP